MLVRRDHSVKPGRRLFLIDGGKALRAGINAVYGSGNPVGRCRGVGAQRQRKKQALVGLSPDQGLKHPSSCLAAAY